MENRLKERLTGAAILVALIVLVVPALFHGQRDSLSTAANGTGDGPTQRSYVIDLKDSAAHDAAAQPAAAATATSAAATPPPTPPVPQSTAGPAAPPGPAVTASAAAPAPTRAEAGNGGDWSVQLGLFALRENAQRLEQAAQSKGFAVSIAGADPGGPYRVHLTGFADRAAAQNARVRLRAQGFDAALVGPQGREP